MTITMSVQEQIRRMDAEGVPARQIARDLGVSRDSVAKYVAVQDYSPRPVVVFRRPSASALTGFTAIIDTWLAEDAGRPRKQRHTAQRVFDRLRVEHGYGGSYSPVQRYIKAYKARRRSAGDGFSELVWSPGVAQVDFGQACALIAGVMQLLHVLVVTFPFSNMRYAQAYAGETAECVCHGLRTIFERAGGAARELIFDNATPAGRRVGQVVVESRLFAAFKLHYRCAARYCNPYSGHEKGSVENAVGFLRRNLMVPEPAAASMAGLNEVLLARCDELAGREHYRKAAPIGELFTQDRAALLALPGIGFDPVRYESRICDKTGSLAIDGTTYLAGPALAGRRITIALRHDRVEILGEDNRPVTVLPRRFGAQPETVFDPASLLPLLVRKPGTWSNSLVRARVSEPVRDWLDHATSRARRDMLAAISAATGPAGFDNAIAAADALIRRGDSPEPAASTVNLAVYDGLTHANHTGTTDAAEPVSA